MLDLFVLDTGGQTKIPAVVHETTEQDLQATANWQTSWLSKEAASMPNKVSLRRADTDELLGLMSYFVDGDNLMVEIIYIESAKHSNGNMLPNGEAKKYIGIAKALFAYAVNVSKEAGFGGVLVFKAKTTELVEYYIKEFCAKHAGSYDPFRLVLWEDAADRLIAEFDGRLDNNEGR